jgi:hypothetical protein
MAVEPIVDHRMSQRLRLLTVAGDDFPCAFNITGMNGYAPLIPFDPGADGVPYTSVFHQGTFAVKLKAQQQSSQRGFRAQRRIAFALLGQRSRPRPPLTLGPASRP